MKSRGFLFTTGLALLALAVLSLAMTGVFYRQRLQDSAYSMAAAERVVDEHSSVSSGLRDLVVKASGIALEASESSVTFSETLPNPHAPAFQASLDAYAAFALNNTDNTRLSLNAFRNNLPLEVRPHGLTYSHFPYGGGLVRLTPSSTGLNYTVEIRTTLNITTCSWNVPAGDNTLRLRASVLGEPGSCADTVMVDPSRVSGLSVNSGAVHVDVGPGGVLSVGNAQPSPINVSIAAFLTPATDNIIGVWLPDGVVETGLADFGVSKAGGTRII
jgi:hypothetical protein